MIKSFAGLRFIFALLICAGHFVFTSPKAGTMLNKPLFFDTTAAVTFFFILSGFSLAYGFSQKMIDNTFKPFDFLKKRFFKLYPTHILALIIVLLLFGKYYDWNAETKRNLLLNIFLLQSYVPDMNCYFAFNRVSWYLSSLFFLYIVFAFFFKSISKSSRPMWILAILSAIWSIALVLFAHYQKSYDHFVFCVFPPTRLLQFFIGAWLFLFYKKLKKININTHLQISAEFISIIMLIFSWLIRDNIPEKYEFSFLYVPSCSLIILSFALNDGNSFLSRFLGSKTMISLGNISYPFYMFHLFCQNIVAYITWNLSSEKPFTFFVIYLIFTIGISYAVNFLFVKKTIPFIKKRNKSNE